MGKSRKSTAVPKRRRGRKLVALLALAGIGAIVLKNLRAGQGQGTASYEPPAPRPPVTPAPVEDVVPVEEPAAEPVVDEPVAVEETVDQDAEPTQKLTVDAVEEPPAQTEEVVDHPAAVAPVEEPEQAPPVTPEAESLTSFFDQVLAENEAAAPTPKKPRKRG